MKHANSIALVAMLLLSCTPPSAFAESGLTIAGSVGSASLTEAFDGLDVDTDSTAFRFTIGWQFNDYFTLEGGYHNFGRFEQTVDVDGTPVEVSLKADGFTLGVTGSLPLGERFSLFGRAGAFFWDGDADLNGVSQARPEDTNLFLGFGLSYRLTEKLELTGDWSRYELEDTESDVASLGLRYRF
jgi:OOP family OmpA-OmpF porin